MQEQWNNDLPIYRQLHDRMVGLILNGSLPEGDAIPSVRTVAAEYQINHLTVSKAYQALVDEGLVEKKRGLGMFVLEGAQKKVLKIERTQFMTVELPNLLKRIQQLGISGEELMTEMKNMEKESS